MATQSRPIPLTRREQQTIARARDMGLSHFGEFGLYLLASFPSIARALAGLTDNERHGVFYELDDFVRLLESFRGRN